MTIAALKEMAVRAAQPGLAFGVADPGDSAPLYPQEAVAIAKARNTRRAEFAMGRLAARRAILAFGANPSAIPMGQDRAPIWPVGLVGSISHSNDLAIAVIGSEERWLGLGLDLEPLAPLHSDLINDIARPEERDTLGDEPGLSATKLFSAKEAAYKAQYPITRTVFGFHSLQVSLNLGVAFYADHPECAEIKAQDRSRILPLRQWCESGMILSLSAIPR